jgi:hypothetical protein
MDPHLEAEIGCFASNLNLMQCEGNLFLDKSGLLHANPPNNRLQDSRISAIYNGPVFEGQVTLFEAE